MKNYALETLFQTVLAARDLPPEQSRTARLMRAGPKKAAQKLIEEAAELGLEAALAHRQNVVMESADVLYQLCVLWALNGTSPQEVMAEIARRQELFGIAEKLPKKHSRLPGRQARGAA